MEAEALWQRYILGDKSAFDGIVDMLRDNLIFFINRYTHNLDAAEDISQDTFLALLLHPKLYNYRVKLKTYLFTIARYKAVNYVKHESRRSMLMVDMSVVSEEYAAFEEQFFADSEKKRLYAAASKLPPDYAQVIYLIYFEDMTYDEAGRVMRKNRKQIENLAYRARAALREEMGKEQTVT